VDCGSREWEACADDRDLKGANPVAWAYVQTVDSVDLQGYDAISAEIGEETPTGAIWHAAGLYEGKLRILEVWESEDAYRRFREERLAPALNKVMGPEAAVRDWPPPGFEPMQVHNLLQADAPNAA
jgi:hypothetical protein